MYNNLSLKSHVAVSITFIVGKSQNSNHVVTWRGSISLVGWSSVSDADTENILCPGGSRTGGSRSNTPDTPPLQPDNHQERLQSMLKTILISHLEWKQDCWRVTSLTDVTPGLTQLTQTHVVETLSDHFPQHGHKFSWTRK